MKRLQKMAHVDVLLPVKNAAPTIGEAIDSVLGQTLRDLRLLVIDDGSSDATPDIVKAYAEKDARVELMGSTGQGIVDALNSGLDRATAPFVARMDGDDICAPTRLERQLAFMEAHRDVAAVGSRIACFGSKTGSPPMVLSAAGCRAALCLYTPICHPTVLMRRDALSKLGTVYTKEFPHAEDYDLFTRLVAVGDICNLDEPLLNYRLHDGQVSKQNQMAQRRVAFQIASRYIARTYGVERGATAKIIAVMCAKAIQLGPSSARESFRAVRNAVQVNMG